MKTISLRGGATIANGVLIAPGTPGSKPNTAPKGFARIGSPKNFKIADNVAGGHGVHPRDVEIGVIGGTKGQHPDPSAGISVHPGMIHSHRGAIVAGISHTQAAFDDEPNTPLPTTPKASHENDPFTESLVCHGGRPVEYHQTPGIHGLNGALPLKIRK